MRPGLLKGVAMSEEQMNDSTFGRLFIIMIIVMTVLTVVIMVLASLAASDVNAKLDERYEKESTQSLADRLAPVGTFAAETVAAAPEVVEILEGQAAYASCGACHTAGVAGAPALADKAAWSDRIAKDINELYENAIKGYQGSAGYMPPKGGNVALDDQSVRNAVDYMVEAAK